MQKKKILLVNDLPGVGKVALGAMIPILSYLGFSVHNLPTAIVSNTLDYGDFHILDTTDYMKETTKVWTRLGFSFDAVATGFITTSEEIELVEKLIASYAKKPYVMVDPIMGDHGSLYNGIDESRIALMRTLVGQSDLSLPNLTEANFLTRGEGDNHVTREVMDEIRAGMKKLGAKSYLVTSVHLKEGGHYMFGYDHVTDEPFEIPYEKLPYNFPGTGDVFSAILLAAILRGDSLMTAAKRAHNFIAYAIEKNREFTENVHEGLFIERHLVALKEMYDA